VEIKFPHSYGEISLLLEHLIIGGNTERIVELVTPDPTVTIISSGSKTSPGRTTKR
jgi:hypothetical protein|tara:strand:- start:453 stop:620 length:168 start_codon:yes stop_codon:yes gene_type:complete